MRKILGHTVPTLILETATMPLLAAVVFALVTLYFAAKSAPVKVNR
jgi:hypothetical protein